MLKVTIFMNFNFMTNIHFHLKKVMYLSIVILQFLFVFYEKCIFMIMKEK